MKKYGNNAQPVEVWTETDEKEWVGRLEKLLNRAMLEYKIDIPELEINSTDYGVYSIDISDTNAALLPDITLEELEERIFLLLGNLEISAPHYEKYLENREQHYRELLDSFMPVQLKNADDLPWETYIGVVKAGGAELEMIPTREEYEAGYKFPRAYIENMSEDAMHEMEKVLGKNWYKREGF
jgi:hypothetical protein